MIKVESDLNYLVKMGKVRREDRLNEGRDGRKGRGKERRKGRMEEEEGEIGDKGRKEVGEKLGEEVGGEMVVERTDRSSVHTYLSHRITCIFLSFLPFSNLHHVNSEVKHLT